MITHKNRCTNAIMAALRSQPDTYEIPNDVKTALTDALADIRHACDFHSLNFADLDNIAYRNYTEELFEDRNTTQERKERP